MNLGRYLFEVVRDMHGRWYIALVAVLSIMAYGGLAYLAFRDEPRADLPFVYTCPLGKGCYQDQDLWTTVSDNVMTCTKIAGEWKCEPRK